MPEGKNDANENIPLPLTISKTIDDVIRHLECHSFAIVPLPNTTTSLVRDTSDCVMRFFLLQSHQATAAADRCQKIIDGHLHGYNEPSNAKLLFRAFCGSQRQPWPSKRFQILSTKLADSLHELLVEVLSRMQQQQQQQAVDEVTKSGCPLDFFWYHGKHDPAAINCSEHIDRGALIVICLSRVPGLEVRSCHDGEWYCPEDLEVLSSTTTPCCCAILAGDQLKRLLCRISPADNNHHNNSVPACVHRVRNNLPGERLSITYELRL